MNEGGKINVLVIPDLFPEDEDDMKGIFIPDYLKSTAPFCNNTALVMKLQGKYAGLVREKKYGSDLIRFSFGFGKMRSFLKAYYYRKYFKKGIYLASGLTGIDIIHAHGSILSGTIALELSKKWKIPFVITEHAGPFSQISGKPWKFRWTKNILEKADAALNVSKHAESEIINSAINLRKSFVIYNPVDTDLFTISSPKEKIILFAGRLDAFKGAFKVLKAFSRLAAEHPEWKLQIIGDGEEKNKIVEFLKEPPELKNRVIMSGQMRKADLAKEMGKAAFFVFPSLYETFGLVLAEAMACGLPVIGPNRTGPSEFIHAGNGLKIDPENEAELKDAMKKMLASYHTYHTENIRKEIVEKFGFENFGKRLKDIYSETIANYKS